MPPKRTYSRHNLSYEERNPHLPQPDIANTSKRRKPTPPFPGTSLPHPDAMIVDESSKSRRGRRTATKAQKGKSKFGGPTSLPHDGMGMDVDVNVTKTKRNDPFDKALALHKARIAKRQLTKESLYGGGHSSFSASLKQQRRAEKKATAAQNFLSDDSSTDGGIALPAAGAGDDALGSDLSSEDSDTGPSARGGQGLSAAEASARVFERREFVSPQTSPPLRTLYQNKLDTNSMEAHIWSANQANSPLLRLPASVRQTIFEYALGGNTIEFGYTSYGYQQLPNGKEARVPYFKYWSEVYDRKCNPLTAAFKPSCDMLVTQGMALLNGVCRQLYYETYTLPYALNHFMFSKSVLLFNFIMEERLLPQQLKAITSITTSYQLPVDVVLYALPNLEHVRLMNSCKIGESGNWQVKRTAKGVPKLVKGPSVPAWGSGYNNTNNSYGGYRTGLLGYANRDNSSRYNLGGGKKNDICTGKKDKRNAVVPKKKLK